MSRLNIPNKDKKQEVDPKALSEFKRAAELLPTPDDMPENTRRITHTIQFENWEFLRALSSARTKVAGKKVTINSLLDEAVEMLKAKYGNGIDPKS